MWTKIIAWLRKETQSVEKIVSGLTSMVEELEAHIAAKVNEEMDHWNDVEVSATKAKAAAAEHEKALAVAAKIQALVS